MFWAYVLDASVGDSRHPGLSYGAVFNSSIPIIQTVRHSFLTEIHLHIYELEGKQLTTIGNLAACDASPSGAGIITCVKLSNQLQSKSAPRPGASMEGAAGWHPS